MYAADMPAGAHTVVGALQDFKVQQVVPGITSCQHRTHPSRDTDASCMLVHPARADMTMSGCMRAWSVPMLCSCDTKRVTKICHQLSLLGTATGAAKNDAATARTP
jgi:hypothetical protein